MKMPVAPNNLRLPLHLIPPEIVWSCGTISYQLSAVRDVNIFVFNVNGQLIRLLVHGQQTAGIHFARWNGLDDLGRQISSGVFLYRLRVSDLMQTQRMLLMK
jgi:flagellar hook assembly protein FlgD